MLTLFVGWVLGGGGGSECSNAPSDNMLANENVDKESL